MDFFKASQGEKIVGRQGVQKLHFFALAISVQLGRLLLATSLLAISLALIVGGDGTRSNAGLLHVVMGHGCAGPVMWWWTRTHL